MAKKNGLRFSIDRGGTFTDIYAEIPGKPGFMVMKLLSEEPGGYSDAPREGIRRIMEKVSGKKIDDGRLDASGIEWIRMGTTVATNALLERKGARCALVVTKGFADILKIGSQERPDIFDLRIQKPDLLYETTIEADERIRILRMGQKAKTGKTVEGITSDRLEILRPLDLTSLRPRLCEAFDSGIRALAVVLIHAYAWPDHEKAIGELARKIGFTQVSLSSEVMPKIKMVPRGDTTMVDAYLNPHIQKYLESFRAGFQDGLPEEKLLFMQSDGALARADGFTGSRAILSGPAGGVVGHAMTTYNEQNGMPVIGFDMGGTSTDVSRFGGEYVLVFETRTAGVRIQAPQLHIKTVAAGGGSRLFFENGMLLAGPLSAGAHPGPVCYRKNGHLSLTDANLVLGRIQREYFPHIFGPDENLPLDLEASRKAMARMTEKINAHLKKKGVSPLGVEQVALGFVKVANETMVRPIREISVMRGFDIKSHVLAAFGGAGPQHACAIARLLGIGKIFVHRFSGILSAHGIGMADVAVEYQEPASFIWSSDILPQLEERIFRLRKKAEGKLTAQGFDREHIEHAPYLNLRYQGTDTPFMIPWPDDNDFAGAFGKVYLREFGFDLSHRDIVVDDIRVRTRGKIAGLEKIPVEMAESPPVPLDTRPCYFEQGWVPTPIFDLQRLKAGHQVSGPAIVIQDTATLVIEPGCNAVISTYGDVQIQVGQSSPDSLGTAMDPVQLSIFGNLFMSIAEQMGRMLQKTAISTNIKERLDFSCALFGPEGELVANAPHLPVHLGAMSEAVKEQIKRRKGDLKPGDVLVSNHPDAGGSHLPDITVITPVFQKDRIIFWVASRGHHADIGGISPGSMPPHSRTLDEEGAAIISFKLVTGGRFQEDGIRALLRAPEKITPAPGRPRVSGARRISDNLSDLKAQVAANRKGIELVLEMADRYGLGVVQAYMAHVQDAAEEAVRNRLCEFSKSRGMKQVDTVTSRDYLDNGSPVVLSLTIDRRDASAVFDFSGTGPEIWGNCNAPVAVTKSAILYCLRCLIEKELPLNHGCSIPITVKIPGGSLLNPSANAAVVGGNVLTSQRVVDVVLKAFGAAAASQGCMNNFTFGNEKFGYYETIGGGAGAGPTWQGQDGVHTHMTNTRITDPEILERRYPVLLREFSVRKGSGGSGKFKGGDGLAREVEFLETLNVAILSERRVFAPYGMDGGGPGARGRNLFIFKDGRVINLGAKNEIIANPGDRIRIETPGGGGFGKP